MKTFYFMLFYAFMAVTLNAANADVIDYTKSLYFEESCPGSYVTKDIVIKNFDFETVKILRNPVISGPDASYFSIVNNPLLNNDIDLPPFDNGENALNLTVKFTYVKGDTSLKTARLTIWTNYLPMELNIDLSGSSTNTLYTFNPYNLDHGSVAAGLTLRDTINFTNLGFEPVRLDSVLFGTQKLGFQVRNVAAGDTAQIPLEFNFPSSQEIYSSVRVFMNAACMDTLIVPFHAIIDGSVFSVTRSLDYGDSLICGSKVLPVVIRPGSSPLSIESISPVAGPNASVFSVVNPPATPLNVPNEGLSLNVLYSPKIDIKFGIQQAEFTLKLKDGKGAMDVKVSLTAFIWKDSVGVSQMDFGNVWVGAPATLPLTISNRPKFPIVIDSVVLLSGTLGFSLDAAAIKNYPLAPNQSVDLDVSFNSFQQGSFKDTARIFFSMLDCTFIRDVTLSATAHGATMLRIWPEVESAEVDPKLDNFRTGIYATSPADSVIASNYSLDSIVVSLPRQMLFFKALSKGRLINQIKDFDRIRLTIQPEAATAPERSLIAEIECAPLLGAVERDSIVIEQAFFTDKLKSISLTTEGKELNLVYCDRGGKRLLDNRIVKAEATSFTRSSDGRAGVKFVASEVGRHALRAYDAAGRLIFQRDFNCSVRGENFEFILDELDPGLVIIAIEAPGEVVATKVLVAGF